MIGGRVLDVSAIADFALGRTLYARALAETALDYGVSLVVPAAALAEACSTVHTREMGGFIELLAQPTTVIDPLDTDTALQVGVLLKVAQGSATVGTGHVLWSAYWRDWPVITADPWPLRALDPDVHLEQLP